MKTDCAGPAHARGEPNDRETEDEYIQWCLALYGEAVWIDDFEPSPLLPPCEQPNDGDGWAEHWPVPGAGHRPPPDLPVVYQLHEERDEPPVYVGSTGDLPRRMAEHSDAGRRWTWWSAQPCSDRAEAYRREGELIALLQPRDNVVGRHT